MTIIATILTRDAEDLIGPLIEHHCRQGVAGFLLTDNGSTDDTVRIASRYPEVLDIVEDPHPVHIQGSRVTRMARKAASIGRTWLPYKKKADWIVHLDQDEFWVGLDRLESLDEGVILVQVDAVWMHLMMPDSPQRCRGFSFEDAPFYDEDHRVTRGKIIHRPDPEAEIWDGNHGAILPSLSGEVVSAPEGLGVHHYSVRDYASFRRKAAQGAAAVAGRTDAGPTYAHHWKHWGELLDSGNLLRRYTEMLRENWVLLERARESGTLRRWPCTPKTG